MSLDRNKDLVTKRFALLDQEGFLKRLADQDVTLWKSEPKHLEVIGNRLGWVGAPDLMRKKTDELTALTDEVRQAGFTHAVVLGMGGSSLFPEVCRKVFGVRPGFLDVSVLDSTHPSAVLDAKKRMNFSKTLFIVSSKSGTTTETLSLFAYLSGEMQRSASKGVGPQCIAITDPGTPLEKVAREQSFRRIFLNPPDIGGRFSALSYFGLVPAALLGVDIRELLKQACDMVATCDSCVRAQEDPGVQLGAALAEWAALGRDKVTLTFASELSSFGVWLEQLLAESTGKEGKGLIPIEGELLGKPEVYGKDRVFVHFSLGVPEDKTENKLALLEAEGHPVIRCVFDDRLALGAQCYRWERATAVVGALLGVNPFDEPNVKESKDHTRALLDSLSQGKEPSQDQPLWVEEGPIALYGEQEWISSSASLAEALVQSLSLARSGDYMAILAYLDGTPGQETILRAIRQHLRDTLGVASTLGFGPRYLHSTGQLHKGGPDSGVFILLTADMCTDASIPGTSYTFGTLHRAQGLGDLRSLRAKGRRVVRIHLGQDAQTGLEYLFKIIKNLRLQGVHAQ